MILQDKINSVRYVAQVVNPVLLSFLWQEGHVLFQQDNARLLQRNMLFMVYNNCLRQKDPQISHQLNTYWTWWSGNLLFFQSLPQPLPNCDNGCKMLRTIYHRMTFGIFMTICMQEYFPALPSEGVHCELMWLSGHPLLWRVFNLIWIYHILLQW